MNINIRTNALETIPKDRFGNPFPALPGNKKYWLMHHGTPPAILAAARQVQQSITHVSWDITHAEFRRKTRGVDPSKVTPQALRAGRLMSVKIVGPEMDNYSARSYMPDGTLTDLNIELDIDGTPVTVIVAPRGDTVVTVYPVTAEPALPM